MTLYLTFLNNALSYKNSSLYLPSFVIPSVIPIFLIYPLFIEGTGLEDLEQIELHKYL